MKRKEPEFMQELHRIRAKLGKEWARMSDKQFLSHMHKVGQDVKQFMHRRKSGSVLSR